MMISVHPLLIPPLRQGNKVAGGNSGEGAEEEGGGFRLMLPWGHG